MKNLLAPVYRFRQRFPLLSYILNRVITMAVTLFILGMVIFLLMDLAPGDIVSRLMAQQFLAGGSNTGADRNFTTEQFAAQRKDLGLDRPFYEQYFRWLNRVIIHHDLGQSLISRAPVSFLIAGPLLNSLTLNLISLVLITFFSFLLGVYFSAKAGTRADLAVTFFALVLHAFPGILLLILLQLFASITGLFPVTAYPPFPFAEAPLRFTFSYLHHI
ncbi:MAG: ABC transporter permease, partial [Treponema sp.]|nr:ABC transporter permease [Treponema sp.]